MFNKKYNSGFLGDLLKIKAFYKLWANHIKKTDDGTDPYKVGLVNNGMFFMTAINVVYVDAASESNIPENVSEEIKEALVSYRTKTYKLNRIKAYEVFKNVSCDRIAKFAPTSLEELKALRCLDEAQITLYGQDIIEIVKQVLNK